jgi:23S rRNA (guanosine2251-2'-O)-methyltransferase
MKAPTAVSTPISPRKRRENRGSDGNQERSPQNRSKGRGREGGSGWIWGAHASIAALANPKRTIHQIMMTEAAQSRYTIPDGAPLPKIVMPGMLDKEMDGAVHQGIAMKCAPLEWPTLESICEHAPEDALILVLDQITDPHNVGAMLRLCSAFGVSALVMQDRNSPPLTGATAKVAVGCVESVPVCRVTNIANTLETLKTGGFFVTGLAGETDLTLSQTLGTKGRHAIVMGAEGPGLRDRVMKTCDQLAKIPMMSSNVAGEAESLNVATAAGIALYEARRG